MPPRHASIPQHLLAAVEAGDLLALNDLLRLNPGEVDVDLGVRQRTALNLAVDIGNESLVVLLLAQCVPCAPHQRPCPTHPLLQQSGPDQARRGGAVRCRARL